MRIFKPKPLSIAVVGGCILAISPLARSQQQTSPLPQPNDPGFAEFIKTIIPPPSATFPLYAGAIPDSRPVPDNEGTGPFGMITNVTRPTIESFLPAPAKAIGAAVVIFPGGAYVGLSMATEGVATAQHFQDHGYAAFVVKYRLPNDASMIDRTIAPLEDAQQAMRFVHQHAAEWHLDPLRVGVIGFSAGGHLAATLATHFDKAVDRTASSADLRPSFLILAYPVISMDPHFSHPISNASLLGDHPTAEQIGFFSADLNVTSNTPPTLLLAAADDGLVDPDHSIAFFNALRQHKVSAEMILFSKGQHGFFLISRDKWMNPVFSWLSEHVTH